MRAIRVLTAFTGAAMALAMSVADARAEHPWGGERYGDRLMRCESNDGRQNFCPADTRGGVRLARRLSDSSCIEGRTWGARRDGVWVDRGCRADFVLGYGGGEGGAYGRDDIVRCQSRDGRWNRCDVQLRGRVQLARQLSDSRCIEGQTWGYDRRGIWVAGGCRADFRVDRGWADQGQRVRCESHDERSRFCPADTHRGVRFVRQLSDSRCIEGRTWGVERGGVWVDHGCRAEFEVGGRWRGPHDDDGNRWGWGYD